MSGVEDRLSSIVKRDAFIRTAMKLTETRKLAVANPELPFSVKSPHGTHTIRLITPKFLEETFGHAQADPFELGVKFTDGSVGMHTVDKQRHIFFERFTPTKRAL